MNQTLSSTSILDDLWKLENALLREQNERLRQLVLLEESSVGTPKIEIAIHQRLLSLEFAAEKLATKLADFQRKHLEDEKKLLMLEKEIINRACKFTQSPRQQTDHTTQLALQPTSQKTFWSFK